MWMMLGLGGLALSCSMAMAGAPVELLALKLQVDGQVVRAVRFYGTEIDPNRSSAADGFILTINGETVPLSPELSHRLQQLRRSFSYDSQSGGIHVQEPGGPLCLMAGPARGMVLESRYLTYENHRVVTSDLRPVFSLAQNCLFTTRISPRRATAREDARAALEILWTLSQMRP